MLRSSLKTRTCMVSLFLNLIRKVSTEMLLLFIVQNETFSCERSFIAMSSMSFWNSLIQMLKIKQPNDPLRSCKSLFDPNIAELGEKSNTQTDHLLQQDAAIKKLVLSFQATEAPPTWSFIWFHFFGSTSKYSLVYSTSQWGSLTFCLAPSSISNKSGANYDPVVLQKCLWKS